MTAIDQARRYLAKCPPAVSGQEGHNTTLGIVSAIVNGFALDEGPAMEVIREWNAGCLPPWSERELLHKVQEAARLPHNEPRGAKLRKASGHAGKHARTADTARPVAAPAKPKIGPRMPPVEVPFDAELPMPRDDGTRELLLAAFKEGEGVRIAPGTYNDEGKEIPNGSGITLSREDWLAKLEKYNGDANGVFKTPDRNGVFVAINPLSIGGTKDSDVTSYRHALIEWDTLPQEEQFHLIEASKLPVTAVISSGGKSVHAWVRVDARDRAEYDERVRIVHEWFASWPVDQKNKNPSRLSRLAGCERGDRRQELLAVNIGAESFDNWLVSNNAGVVGDSTLPAIECAQTLVDDQTVRTPEELVCGVLHRGMKGVLGSSSKARKTWILLDLAVSVATGKPFWCWRVSQGRVIWINFEIARAFARSRVQAIAKAKGATDISGLDIWTLRGHAAPLWQLLPDLTRQIQLRGYSLVIIDPIYKGLGGRDENSAGEISELCNEVEKLAVDTGAAVIYAAHYSKGNQAGKSAIDRISGSGVFGRDADTLICLTPLETPEAFAVELVLRNHPEHAPFAVAWSYPLMVVRDDLDPAQLKQAKAGRPKTYNVSKLVDLLGSNGMLSGEWRKAADDNLGIGKTAFYDLKAQAENEGLIFEEKMTGKWHRKP